MKEFKILVIGAHYDLESMRDIMQRLKSCLSWPPANSPTFLTSHLALDSKCLRLSSGLLVSSKAKKYKGNSEVGQRLEGQK